MQALCGPMPKGFAQDDRVGCVRPGMFSMHMAGVLPATQIPRPPEADEG